MSRQTLQTAITERALTLRGEMLVTIGMIHHCRRKGGWKVCPCSWCDKKREATRVIGGHVPKTWRGQYVEDMRDAWRNDKRNYYRRELTKLALEM